MRNGLYGVILGVLIAIAMVMSLRGCNEVPDHNPAKIDKVLEIRHDTLRTIDTLRKTRIKYIDTSKIIVLHDTLDKLIPIDTADNDGNQVIAANQLRTALKWKDSLNTCIDVHKVDSVALDTLAKIAKEKPQSNWSLMDRAKDVGAGILIGAGIRSFF